MSTNVLIESELNSVTRVVEQVVVCSYCFPGVIRRKWVKYILVFNVF